MVNCRSNFKNITLRFLKTFILFVGIHLWSGATLMAQPDDSPIDSKLRYCKYNSYTDTSKKIKANYLIYSLDSTGNTYTYNIYDTLDNVQGKMIVHYNDKKLESIERYYCYSYSNNKSEWINNQISATRIFEHHKRKTSMFMFQSGTELYLVRTILFDRKQRLKNEKTVYIDTSPKIYRGRITQQGKIVVPSSVIRSRQNHVYEKKYSYCKNSCTVTYLNNNVLTATEIQLFKDSNLVVSRVIIDKKNDTISVEKFKYNSNNKIEEAEYKMSDIDGFAEEQTPQSRKFVYTYDSNGNRNTELEYSDGKLTEYSEIENVLK